MINLNPLQSSLFTGAGLPWGATKTPEAGDMPSVPTARDINSFQAFDQSDMVKRLISNLRSQGTKRSQAAMRQASRLGAAQSDAARAQLGNISANVADAATIAELQAAKEAWADKMRQKEFAENLDAKRYEQALAQWQYKKQARQAEEGERRAGLIAGLSKIGGIFG